MSTSRDTLETFCNIVYRNVGMFFHSMCMEVSLSTLSLYCFSLWINTLGSHGISVSLVLTHSFWKLNSVSLFYCVFLNVTFCIEKIHTLIKVHREISPHLPGPFLSPHPRKTVVFWGIPPRISVQNTAHYAPVCTLYFFSQSILELFIHEPVDLPLSLSRLLSNCCMAFHCKDALYFI